MPYTASRERIAPVLVKSQTAFGNSNAAPTGTDDALLTVDSPNVTSVSFDMIPYRPHSASLTRQLDLVGPQMANVALSFWMAGSGTNGSTSVAGFRSIAALWRASGATQTLPSGTSISYAPATIAAMRATPTATTTGPANVWAEMDGMLHKINGVYGNMRMTGSPRSGVVCNFTGMGFYDEPTRATISNFTPGSLSYPLFRATNTSCQIVQGSTTYAPVLQSFTFDTGSDVQRIESANASTGIEEHIFVDRNPTLELTFAMETGAAATGAVADGVMNYATMFSHWSGRTTHAVTIKFGSGTGNVCTLSTGQAQIVNLSTGVANGVRTMTVSYKVQHSTPEGEWTFAIAAS